MRQIELIMLVVILCFFISCKEETEEIPNQFAQNIVSSPTLFEPGLISTEEHNEFDISFESDGKTIYFTRRIEDQPQKIYTSTYKNDKWSTPEIVSFSTDRDEYANITPDGNTIYFGSSRPIPGWQSLGNFDMNIWRTERNSSTWSVPVPVDSIISKTQIAGEQWPSSNESTLFTNDGETFYFSTMKRGSSTIDIYQTQKTNNSFSEPVKIPELFVKDEYWKSAPTLSPDGKYLFFMAYDVPGGYGGEDLYVSKLEGNSWSTAVNLGSVVNTASEEGQIKFSPDGKYFFFTRSVKSNPDDQDGIYSIFFIETEYLKLEQLFNSNK